MSSLDDHSTHSRGDCASTFRSTPTPVSLPFEVKVLITSYLHIRDVASLSSVSRSWSAAAEARLWRDIDVIPTALRETAVGKPRDRYVERPTLSLSVTEMLIRHIEESWGAVRLALTSRPERLALVKSIRFIATSLFWDDIGSVIPLLAPTLIALELVDPFRPELGGGCAFDVIDLVRNLPALRVLYIDFQEEWYMPFVSVLRAAPNLEVLSISVVTEQRKARPMPEDDLLPDLPKLRSFSMTPCRGLFALLPRLARRAKHLLDLEAGLPGGMLRRHHIDCIRPFVHLETLKTNDATIFHEIDYGNGEELLPKLRTLITSHDFVIPHHPNLKHLVMLSTRRPFPPSPHLGTLGKPNETGKLPGVIAQALIYATSLLTITLHGMKPRGHDPGSLPEMTLIVRSFFDPEKFGNTPNKLRTGRTLYHVRVECEYPELYEELFFASRFAHRRNPYYEPNMEEVTSFLREDGPSWIDMTFFQDWPLPLCLLDYVYESIGRDRYSRTPERGIKLPEEVWEVLEGWKAGIEIEKKL